MSDKIKLAVLGSTGTIGVNTLDVVARYPDRFEVLALTARGQAKKLLEQIRAFRPREVVLLDLEQARWLEEQLAAERLPVRVSVGEEALCAVAADPDVDAVMAAIVGAAGLKPSLAAARAGKRILLANKETLVVSGQLFIDAVKAGGAELLPIDSEHNAVFQVWPRDHECLDGVRRILLTASGGPFRRFSREEIEKVTPEQALNHPNWVMGRKITIDSATMMNKGLEVIEAHWLFGMEPDRIDVVVHPQSIIHSLVEYIDGSVLAQLSNPDMRTPIAYALGYPDRLEAGVRPLDLFEIGNLTFEKPDTTRFPCLAHAFAALRAGGLAPAVLNAANEVAVEAFLDHRIPFGAIPAAIAQALDHLPDGDARSLEDVLAADRLTRESTTIWLAAHHA